jgi:hypothetical protein
VSCRSRQWRWRTKLDFGSAEPFDDLHRSTASFVTPVGDFLQGRVAMVRLHSLTNLFRSLIGFTLTSASQRIVELPANQRVGLDCCLSNCPQHSGFGQCGACVKQTALRGLGEIPSRWAGSFGERSCSGPSSTIIRMRGHRPRIVSFKIVFRPLSIKVSSGLRERIDQYQGRGGTLRIDWFTLAFARRRSTRHEDDCITTHAADDEDR